MTPSSKSREHCVRARWILTGKGPPIENAVISVVDGVIQSVNHFRDQHIDEDLGEVALLPGLTNAHTHLEFSHCRSPLGTAGMELADWVADVITSRQRLTDGDRNQAVRQGWEEAVRTGTTLIGDIVTPPCPAPSAISRQAPETDAPATDRHADVIAFAETLGLSSERGAERLAAARQHLRDGAVHVGISPHAPYSTPIELVRACVNQSRTSRVPLAMHLAESKAELELLQQGRGPFAERLTEMGLDVAAHFPHRETDPVGRLIELLSTCHRGLLVHCNYLTAAQIERIAKADSLSVVMCPRTHAYFQHERHPVAELWAAGVRVALGTDSRASNPDLNLWGEVQYLLRHRPDLPPWRVIAMATTDGYRALMGRQGGGLLPGHDAIWHKLPTAARNHEELFEACCGTDPVV